jgi:hypothetical protein
MTRTAFARVRWTARMALAVLVAALLAFAPRPLRADARTDFLIGRLKADDFRVRTNAALALGQSGDAAALTPLCTALSDSSDVVRQAVVAALQKLAAPGASACLKSRRGAEPSQAVQRAIDRAVAALEASSSSPSAPSTGPPAVVANAKFYVAISPITNQTGRSDDEVTQVVGGAVRAKLAELGGIQIAPDHETPDQARTAMGRRKLTGFYLSIRVERFDYSDGNLRVRVKVAVFTYPGKDLRGEVPAGLTQTGVSPGDKAAEDNLLQLASARAVELFAQNFQ